MLLNDIWPQGVVHAERIDIYHAGVREAGTDGGEENGGIRMSEINLLKEYCRMCNETGCNCDCPIDEASGIRECQEWMFHNINQATEIITKWAKEHPQKTRQDVFLERYAKAMVDDNGVVCIDPCNVEKELRNIKCCKDQFLNCYACRRKYWLTPAEEEE